MADPFALKHMAGESLSKLLEDFNASSVVANIRDVFLIERNEPEKFRALAEAFQRVDLDTLQIN